MLAWYLIYSKPRQERVALTNLERQGYTAHLPLVRRKTRRQGRPVWAIEAMFPRYLFVRLDDTTDDWGPIRSTLGVSNLVRFGNQAARVPDAFMHLLQGSADENGVRTLEGPQLKAGDTVRISEGVMAGYQGVFSARTGKERVLLLLEIAGNVARLEVDAGMVERL